MNEDILKTHLAYKMARETYGLDFELNDLQEECAELIVATNKLKRNNYDEISLINFFEEIGDVENLIQQMKFWFPHMVTTCNVIRLRKLNRLKERINGNIK